MANWGDQSTFSHLVEERRVDPRARHRTFYVKMAWRAVPPAGSKKAATEGEFGRSARARQAQPQDLPHDMPPSSMVERKKLQSLLREMRAKLNYR
jgi:hypothetical protein